MNLLDRLQQPAKHPFWQLVRYVISGGTSTCVDMLVLWLLANQIGIHYLVATSIAYLAGLLTSYTFATFWVFNEHRTNNRMVELIGYAIIGGIGYLLTTFLMWLFVDVIFSQSCYIFFGYTISTVMLSKAIVTVLVSLSNFTLRKFVLFKKGTK